LGFGASRFLIFLFAMPIEQKHIIPVSNFEFMTRQIVEGFMAGLHKSPFHGFSVEFAEHRIYNNGDSVRNVDWKLYGRTDKLFVKRYEEETNLRCQLLVDQSSSMYFPVRRDLSFESPNKLWFSVYAAAALMDLMLRQRDAVGLDLFDDKIDFHAEAKLSLVQRKLILGKLEKLLYPYNREDLRPTSATACLHRIAETLHKRSLVIIFSDMLDSEPLNNLFEALEHLRYNGHEVILFHVFDGDLEINLDFENRPYRFVDLENRESMRLNPTEFKEMFTKAMLERKESIIKHCYRHRIDYVEADINKGYEQILTSYLIKRQKLY